LPSSGAKGFSVFVLLLVLVLEYTGVSSILRTRCNLRETPWKRAKGTTKNIKDGGAAILRRTLSAKQCNCWSKGIEL
jgi:hypothetical protein